MTPETQKLTAYVVCNVLIMSVLLLIVCFSISFFIFHNLVVVASIFLGFITVMIYIFGIQRHLDPYLDPYLDYYLDDKTSKNMADLKLVLDSQDVK